MKPRVILPFIDEGTYKIAKFLRLTLGVEIGYYPGIKLGAILSNFKEKKKLSDSIGVYILKCNDCKGFYIEELDLRTPIQRYQHTCTNVAMHRER